MHDRRVLYVPRLAVHTGFGATFGALFVGMLLAIDAFSLGSLVQQNDNPLGHLTVMLVKSAVLFGLAALGWSLWRQLDYD